MAPRLWGAVEEKNPWRFQGRRFDAETGLFFFRQRYLDPAQGRFVSRDPLGLWGDPGNLGGPYSCVGNDPVNRMDPTGKRGADYLLDMPMDVGETVESVQSLIEMYKETLDRGGRGVDEHLAPEFEISWDERRKLASEVKRLEGLLEGLEQQRRFREMGLEWEPRVDRGADAVFLVVETGFYNWIGFGFGFHLVWHFEEGVAVYFVPEAGFGTPGSGWQAAAGAIFNMPDLESYRGPAWQTSFAMGPMIGFSVGESGAPQTTCIGVSVPSITATRAWYFEVWPGWISELLGLDTEAPQPAPPAPSPSPEIPAYGGSVMVP